MTPFLVTGTLLLLGGWVMNRLNRAYPVDLPLADFYAARLPFALMIAGAFMTGFGLGLC